MYKLGQILKETQSKRHTKVKIEINEIENWYNKDQKK
jgi:hypothetical protein